MKNNVRTIKVKFLSMVMTLVLTGIFVIPGYAQNAEKETLAKELATILRSGRKVISVKQSHINDPEVGDKGLSSEMVLEQTRKNYEEATGGAMGVDDAQLSMMESIEEVMDEAQSLINEKGKGLKMFLPAVFAKQVSDRFTTKMIGQASMKLTAPNDYLRNPENKADAWENDAIENKFRSEGWEKDKTFSENAQVGGSDVFRFILPEYYGASCLKCHGDPKGELDITGGAKEGGVLGELGGAISVVLY